jgi:diguanylate cyclase (GGDEF)-like protein
MSAVPADVAFDDLKREARRGSARTRHSYVWVVVAGAVAVTAVYLPRLAATTHGWPTFGVLAAAVVAAQLFVGARPSNQRYQPATVFLLAGALLLPGALVALLPLAQLRRRGLVQLQAFTIAASTLATIGAWRTAAAIHAWGALGKAGATTALADVAACLVFIGVSRAVLYRERRLLTYENLATDVVLASLGVGLATIWQYDAWVTFFAVPPLLMVNRSLAVPALRAETRVDPKTGLFNARHLAATLRDELSRAIRFERPMALVMADLDLLRETNNTYGHLAGDAVLTGVAKIFQEQLREYDVPARFGGEEFAILLPETHVGEALEIAERIRRAVAGSEFRVSTSKDPIHATVSMGVAVFPRDGCEPNELVHQADLAVYRAKLEGRNRVVDCSEAGTGAVSMWEKAERRATV